MGSELAFSVTDNGNEYKSYELYSEAFREAYALHACKPKSAIEIYAIGTSSDGRPFSTLLKVIRPKG